MIVKHLSIDKVSQCRFPVQLNCLSRFRDSFVFVFPEQPAGSDIHLMGDTRVVEFFIHVWLNPVITVNKAYVGALGCLYPCIPGIGQAAVLLMNDFDPLVFPCKVINDHPAFVRTPSSTRITSIFRYV